VPQITSSDGVRLNYVESGDPAGRPVLLVAGFKAAASSWKPQLSALEKAGYRVIAFDRRGHGDSEIGPDGSHTMDRHGADIGDVVRELGLTDVTVVGQSMGGN
jgi:pimeloyl-ACP methyl ester carboxylesterase